MYVDKTRLVYQLTHSGKYFFLSRPRRFGKSLLISTLKAYFEGKKELFQGLALEKLEADWTSYPVLHLDLNSEIYQSQDSLLKILKRHLLKWARSHSVDLPDDTISGQFESIIEQVHAKTNQKIVILVDEYDKPLLETMDNPELQESYRRILKGFYGMLKSMDQYIRFAMLTGVTKFGKVSVFSDLNNLNDISLDESYHDICGITEVELLDNFTEELQALSLRLGKDMDDTLKLLKENYDGYHFCASTSPGLYNPFSLLNALSKSQIGSYWFATGTPTFLVKLIQKNNGDLDSILGMSTSADVLNCIDLSSNNPVSTLYQSGYLTIKSYDDEYELYNLGFPNKEVEKGFYEFMFPFYTSLTNAETRSGIVNIVQDIRNGNVEGFMRWLKSLFADTPYELVLNLENYYQNVLHILFKLLGFYVQAERHTSVGRIDLLLQTSLFVYVMELKLDKSAQEALAQIDSKEYALAFEASGRKIFKIGINFSSKTRNIEDWIIA